MCGNRPGVTCISNWMTVKGLDDITSKWYLAEKAMGTWKRPLDMVTFRIQMESSYCNMMGEGREESKEQGCERLKAMEASRRKEETGLKFPAKSGKKILHLSAQRPLMAQTGRNSIK